MKSEKRKALLGILVFGFSVAFFTGCTPKEKESNPDKVSTTVTFTSTIVESSVVESSTEENSSVIVESKPTSEPTSEPDNSNQSTPQPPAITPTPEWTETAITQTTMYVNTANTSSRKKATVGAATVKTYNVNDSVVVVAKTSTSYYKLKDGTFIHSDYLQTSKVTIQSQPSSSNSDVPVPTPSTNTNRVPIDENHDIYGNEMTGGWVTKPGGTYWKEGRNYYRSREDALYRRNPVSQGEVDGVPVESLPWDF